MIGKKLAHYQIIKKLGEGGMGVVYQARDTRLDRMVAIKTSKTKFGVRFEREARAVASLSHPNICTLHDVGPDYLVMEYIEGKPIKGPVALEEALRIGIQIASALEAAHRAGIVHRDLKPSNVLRTKTGVKLLDFGLAKVEHKAEEISASQRTLTLTEEGAVIGTLQYMSPEQVQGKTADARSDIFAFGAVLYELLAGTPAFAGENPASIMAAILAKEPPPIPIGEGVPEAVKRILRRCLQKDPDRRWQTATDLLEELEWVAGGGASSGTGTRAKGWAIAGLLAAGAAALAALAVGWLWSQQTRETHPAVRFTVAMPFESSRGNMLMPHVSPDGQSILYGHSSAQKGEYWIFRLPTAESVPVRLPAGILSVTWSPESREILFMQDRKLVRFDLASSTSTTLGSAPDSFSQAPAWSPAGFLLASENQSIQYIRPDGSGRRVVTQPKPSETHWFPEPLPDGKHFLYKSTEGGPLTDAIYRGNINGGPRELLFRAAGRVRFAEPGYLLFVQGDALRAIKFDTRKNEPAGAPLTVASRVASDEVTGLGMFTASRTGVLAFLPGTGTRLSRLTWIDRRGRVLGKVGEMANYINPALSPDESRLAIDIRDQQTGKRDVWVFDLSRGTRTRFTSDAGDDLTPVFSPDGERIAFVSDRTGQRKLYFKSTSGSGEEKQAMESTITSVHSWSADGRHLLVDQFVNYQTDIHSIDLSTPQAKLSPLLMTAFPEGQSRFSPDGSLVAYVSAESGRREVYVQSFPPGRGRWQVSREGGVEPQWRGDGRELFFTAGDKMMAVSVRSAGGRFEAGEPHALFELRLSSTLLRNRWVVTRDGQRFLAAVPEEEPKIRSFNVIVNWPTLLDNH